MTAWRHPGDPDPELPPEDDERSPNERPPAERDPEAQRAPGAGEDGAAQPPPMQADPAHQPVGNDNIRDGTVGGVMGPPHQSMGQGQGG